MLAAVAARHLAGRCAALLDARALLATLVESAEAGRPAWPLLDAPPAAAAAGRAAAGERHPALKRPPEARGRRAAERAAACRPPAVAAALRVSWEPAAAAANAPPAPAGADSCEGAGAGSTAAASPDADLRRALAALHEGATAGAASALASAAAAAAPAEQAQRLAAAARLVARCADRLAPADLAAAAVAAARLAAAGGAAAVEARAVLAAAEAHLPELTAPQLAALAAAWPPDGADGGAAAGSAAAAAGSGDAAASPSSSSSTSNSSGARILACLESALRRRQPPGSWDAAAAADLAAALSRHRTPRGSGAFLSLAMVTVDLAAQSRARAPAAAAAAAPDGAAGRGRLSREAEAQAGGRAAAAAASTRDGEAEADAEAGAAAEGPVLNGEQLLAVASAFAGSGHYNRAAFDVLCADALAALQAAGRRLAPGPAPDVGAGAAGAAEPARPGAGLTAQQLASFLGCCARARHFDPRLLSAAADALARCRHDVGLEALAEAAEALATLNVTDAALFARASQAAQHWLSAALASLPPPPPPRRRVEGGAPPPARAAPSGPASAAVALAWALGAAGSPQREEAFFSRLCRWLLVAAPRFPPRELARLHEVQWALADAAVAARGAASPAPGPPPSGRAGAAAGAAHGGGALLPLSLPPSMLNEARAAWLSAHSGPRGPRAAEFASEVYSSLRDLGLPASMNVPTSCGMHVLDLLVRVPSAAARAAPAASPAAPRRGARVLHGAPLTLSLDGPEAFAANAPAAPMGSTAARWRALQARGFQVVSLRWSDWARLRTPEAKRQLLWAAIVESARAGPAGVAAAAAAAPAPAGAEGEGDGGSGGARRAAARWWQRVLDGGG
ncbi:hypothetical protein Rsub_00098 [Raphidocelis subcapitata]|uniref:Uncharacterized protein n=1 Tax=Raphidocelis subcapitata TaxID=307507 RepID=A0A2V0NR26_9CHLO|nr:hypothetical protein Rsub_00098 [Raphidocelis subcapitata]|eukprot:GBF87387.1 hypothetical protein Rsub_00098 [Raphidocelis subcapitata]